MYRTKEPQKLFLSKNLLVFKKDQRLFFFLKILFFWLRWVFVAVRGLSLVAASGGYSSLQCVGFSLR